ncbi:serine protease [Candidatus Phycorickettsia trachydisci]|uniref:Serine protease n=1 Tax=Candidatus Phycorickettsia trachydisci TaxID=2115978 RepID=A0A2P1P7D3_9RICK|nr:S1C family serine protease [Candidatus Phycorickettsia trachydisci]AVP87177.1 serine protease [Candidatus Phycorickettsia trachydisci]
MKKFVFCLFFIFSSTFADIKDNVLDKARKSTVTIEGRAAVAAYGSKGSWSGTGFIANKAKGIIITNEHVTKASNSIANYSIKFHNGRLAQAKLGYYDLWLDFSFLQVNPKDIPDDVQEINFSTKQAFEGQHVFIVGNTEGQSFSFHDGYISNPFEISGDIAQHTFVVNLNIAGGASGSPVLNDDGDAVAITYGGSKTYALALHGSYISNALKSYESGVTPQRRHIGVITKMYSLDKVVKHKNFPESLMIAYLKDFPDSRNNVLAIKAFIPGSKASDKLQNGDIIWEVAGKRVGPSLYEFDHLMDSVTSNTIDLTIYRNGQKIPVTLDLYNLEDNKISKMLEFGGAVLFETNDLSSYASGIPIKSLGIAYIAPGSGLSVRDLLPYSHERQDFRLKINKIGSTPVKDIDSAVKAICSLNGAKFITMDFENFNPFITMYNGTITSRRDLGIADIVLSNTETLPKLYTFNKKIMEWELNENPCKQPQ